MVTFVHISDIEKDNETMRALNLRNKGVFIDEIPINYRQAAQLFIIGRTVEVFEGKLKINYLDFKEFYFKLNGIQFINQKPK